jgi:beta-phosphoglucomutase-like phosphatase (HAD superfamily)
MPIQAFFWDYDNTILETADAHWNKHCIVLKRYGIELPEIFRQRIYENNGAQNWEWMKNELGLKVPENEYLDAVDSEFQKSLGKIEIRPGVVELFKWLVHLGIPQAIITNARRNSAEPVLKEKEILPLMKFVLYKEDYEGRKPEPAPYLAGIKKMESFIGRPLAPKECLVVEDDPKGVESAHKAGAIVIHRKLNEEEADCPYADYSCFQREDFLRIVRELLT